MLCLCGKFYLASMLNKMKIDARNLKDNTHILDWLHKRGVKFGSSSCFFMFCLCKNNIWAIDWFFKHHKTPEKWIAKDPFKLAGRDAKSGATAHLKSRLMAADLR